jgi:ketosteroid isomerase-like protein
MAQRIAEEDEAELRKIFQRWTEAVHAQDYNAIRQNHAPDILMFDVPLLFLSGDRTLHGDMETILFTSRQNP